MRRQFFSVSFFKSCNYFNRSLDRGRLHELGGFYASKGYLGRRYSPGQVIDIEIDLTTNHKGFFELRLCPLSGDLLRAETQECFDMYNTNSNLYIAQLMEYIKQ